MRTARIDEIEPIAVVGGELQWRPVRRTLGIEAFGINAYTADAGELVVEEHDETGAGAGHHEELYVVVTGRASFNVNGESFNAPVGTGSRSIPGILRSCTTFHPSPGRRMPAARARNAGTGSAAGWATSRTAP